MDAMPEGQLIAGGARRRGLDKEQLRSWQRASLRRAMVELVAEHGYGGVRMRALCAQAHVSSRDFYRCFTSAHDCFLATYDEIVTIASRQVLTGLGDDDRDWRQRLRGAYLALAEVVVREPAAARLALVEAIGAGPAALARMHETSRAFEQLLASSSAREGDRIMVPPIILTGIVAGVARVMRGRLLAGREDELAELADEVMDWGMRLRCPQAAALLRLQERLPARRSAPPIAGRWTQALHGERASILAAMTRLVAREGFACIKTSHVKREAVVSHVGFRTHFEGPERCLLDALREMTAYAISQADAAALDAGSWARGVHRAIGALVGCMAGDEVFARIASVEVFALGPTGLATREELVGMLAGRLRETAPPSMRPSALAAEASVGAVWGIAHRCTVEGKAKQLPRMIPALSFIVLAPAVGPEPAYRAICAEMGVSVGGAGNRRA